MPSTAIYSVTGNVYIDGVLGDVKWDVSNLSFSFPTSAAYYSAGYGDGEPQSYFAPLNTAQQAAARAALGMYSSVASLTFTEISESSTKHADLRFAMSDAPSTAWAYFPTSAAEGGDSWYNRSSGNYTSPLKGNYAYATFVHEAGHALGLEHAHENHVMPIDRDSMEYTVMSYRSYVGGSFGYTNETWGFAQSLMMYDIAAIQHMYGADYSTHAGDTTYSWSPTTGQMSINGAGQGAPGANRIFLTVWDGGGTDTYDFSNYSTTLKIDLRPGEWTTTSSEQLAKLHFDGSKVAVGNVANALMHNNNQASLIENARGGSGNDQIVGNAVANKLWGGGGNDHVTGGGGSDNLHGLTGNDILIGGAASDHMHGGLNNDTYEVTESGDAVYEAAAEGYDRVYSYIHSYTLTDHAEALNLGGHAFWGIGNTGNNELRGSEFANVLVGRSGIDQMYGGLGNDTYEVTESADAVYEAAAEGYDRVYSYIHSYTLADHVEALSLGGDAFWGIGNTGNNELRGSDIDNVLVGRSGIDQMSGGRGHDTYEVTESGDAVYEGAGEGYDRVFSYIDYTLPANVEALSLGGIGSWGTGNELANSLIGSSAAERFAGLGGSDFLTGQGGDDVFFMFADTSGFGYDTVTDFDMTGDDQIAFSSSLFSSPQASLDACTQNGRDVWITHSSNNVVVLADTFLNTVTLDDFLII